MQQLKRFELHKEEQILFVACKGTTIILCVFDIIFSNFRSPTTHVCCVFFL